MQIAFFPVALESISPTIATEDAIASLCGDGWVRDHEMLTKTGSNGELIVRWRFGSKLLSDVEYAPIGRENLRRYVAAANLLLAALQSGDLHSFVWSPQQRTAFHVPRYYWRSKNALSLQEVFAGMEGASAADDSMVGQAVWLAEAKLETWLATARPRLEAVLAAPADDTKPNKQTRPKPKWYPMLRDLFTAEHRRRADWHKAHPGSSPPELPTAAAFRRKLIDKGWKGDNEPPRQTVEYHCNALKSEFGY